MPSIWNYGILPNVQFSLQKIYRTMMSPYLSKKLSRLSFLGMLTVVYVHSFNFDDRYLWPGRPFFEQLNAANFIQVLITNGLFRFGIPLFFFRAGLLMEETHGKYSFRSRLLKRSQTLLMPYVAWSLIGIGITWLFEASPSLSPFADSAQLRPFDFMRVHEWGAKEWFEGTLLYPISFQLWFLRSLFVYSLLFPLIRKGVQMKPGILIPFLGLLWLFSIGFIIEGEGLLFFSLGVWMAQGGINEALLKEKVVKFKLFWLIPVLLLLKTYLSFGSPDWVTVSYFFHKLIQPILVLGVWFGYDYTLGRLNHTLLEKWSYYNFIIYGLHVPLVYYLTDYLFYAYGKEDNFRLFIFLLLPPVMAGFSLVIGVFLRKLAYPLFWVLTGGRQPVKSN